MPKNDLAAQREALKADIRRLKGGKKGSVGQAAMEAEQSEESNSDDALANTNASHFTVALGKAGQIFNQVLTFLILLC